MCPLQMMASLLHQLYLSLADLAWWQLEKLCRQHMLAL